uniref:Uncharacterized protein n=1 Tax=Romanomermis culicivorax TaxID=13658 RepID=A0A915KUS3_ROMCU
MWIRVEVNCNNVPIKVGGIGNDKRANEVRLYLVGFSCVGQKYEIVNVDFTFLGLLIGILFASGFVQNQLQEREGSIPARFIDLIWSMTSIAKSVGMPSSSPYATKQARGTSDVRAMTGEGWTAQPVAVPWFLRNHYGGDTEEDHLMKAQKMGRN